MHMLDFTPNSETKEMYFQLLLNYDAFQIVICLPFSSSYSIMKTNSTELKQSKVAILTTKEVLTKSGNIGRKTK